MQTTYETRKGAEKILVALAAFDYLTAAQLTRLLYAPSSLSFVRKKLHTLRAGRFVLALPRRSATLPRVYTLSSTGYAYAAALGMQQGRRVRPVAERDKAGNLLFLEHSLAVSDVLIAAQRLSQTHPGIQLTRMITERQLKRKIHVELPVGMSEGRTRVQTICIEPDASLQFLLTETSHDAPQIWEDFIHLEVYRNLPPAEWRFKQKIQGYVTYALTGQHEALFATPALSIAVITTSEQIALTLKRWTEETVRAMQQPEQGGRFFFGRIATTTASPEEIYLAPVWEQAFSSVKTPLLLLE
jgi:hypothetical protein